VNSITRVVALATVLSLGCATTDDARPPDVAGARPARWAAPLHEPGVPNLHRVSGVYYRGAQPTAGGMRELEKLGVKTVVNLRAVHSDRDELGDTKLEYEHISFKAWHAEDEDVVRFLRIVTAPERQPVFVHCQHGADRTGMMTAIYRIAMEGWSKDDAITEMTEGGYGFHAIWKDLVEYVRELDVERLKREAGVSPAPAKPQ
jgi:protein tyrosine/serine phosphatase